jgi:archaeosine-15-forming tRNA-guanine transglycosylase
MTSTEHPSTQPSGKRGDTRTILHGAHRITQVRTVDGWWNISIEARR